MVLINVLRQISVLDVLHGDVGSVRIFEPTEESDEKGRVLKAC